MSNPLRNLLLLTVAFVVALIALTGIHSKDISTLQNQVRSLQGQVAVMQAQRPNGGGAPAASAQTTSAGPITLHAPLILQWPKADIGSRFLVCDNTPGCAPMFNIAANGAQSWGEPFCVWVKTGKVLEPNSCLGGPPNIYPGGDQVPAVLSLYLNGKPVNLTPQAILWLLKAMQIRPRW